MTAYRIAPDAEDDLDAISQYIARDNPPAALRWLDRVTELFERLAEQPGMGRARDDLRAGVRSFPHGEYLLFYTPNPDGIDVVRVIHGARKLDDQL